MNKLHWRTAAPGELALLLEQAQLDGSRAVGACTVYQLRVHGHETLAVSLPDGQALLIESIVKPPFNRRLQTISTS